MKLTAGESFRIAMKRENLKQADIVKETGIAKQNVHNAFKNFDENKGSISTLVEYAKSIGFDVEFNFIKQETEE